jgi:hypothetical protein
MCFAYHAHGLTNKPSKTLEEFDSKDMYFCLIIAMMAMMALVTLKALMNFMNSSFAVVYTLLYMTVVLAFLAI